MKIICPGLPLWSFGLWVKVMRITLLCRRHIPKVDRVQWRKIDAQLCSVLWQSVDPKILLHLRPTKHALNFGIRRKGYTRMISNIASLKEEFLTVMPLTTDVGDQRTQIDKFFMVLMLIGFRLDLETVHDQILGSSSVPSLDDFLKLALEEDAVLHGRPPRNAYMAQSSDPQSPQPPSSSTSPGISLTDSEYDDYLCYQATKSASIASVAQTGNAYACFTHTSSLRPWILDSGASDHILDRSTGKTIGIGRESQGLYHLTAPSTLIVCISTDAPLLIHSRLATLVYPSSRKWSLVFHLCRHLRIPHSLLFSDQPLYVLPPHVFVVLALFIFSLLIGQTFCQSHKMHLSLRDIPNFKRVIIVIPLRLIATFSPLVSLSLRTHRSSPPLSLFLFLKSYPFPLSPHLMQCLLVHFRFIIQSSCHCSSFLAKVPTDSLPIPSASPAPALPPSADLPISFWKVGCRWVYTVKVGPDGQVDRLKALLVAKGYTQILKMLSFMGSCEEVYMEQPPGFVAQGESGLVCSTADHFVFYHHNSLGQCIYLVAYVDDIVITCSDKNGIPKLKQHLFTHFQTKDLGKLKYFLGIEIAQSSSGVVLSQRKYALDILEETGKPLGDPRRYRRLVGKLNYLTITRPDISFPISVVSQFLQSPCDSHWDAVIRILRYIKSTPGQDRRSTSGYCVFIGGNLISWKSKKQDVVARSSAEAEYPAMALATCELIWLKHLLRELRFGKDEQMKLICDNQAALHIASNQSSMKRPNTLNLLSLYALVAWTALLTGFYVIEKKFFLQGSMSKTMDSIDGKRGENWAMTMEEKSRAQSSNVSHAVGCAENNIETTRVRPVLPSFVSLWF
ncbi:Retrovirus-related Pol polyprotein from transposon RE2 [Vitis vinifera]|uniref:Retrovirus-related Pol polyprotein from transposon RE2 n=1 Tax=Vitis vinifera TaxID=29760 RepID=A0A438BMW2_VITVI|nr:Retrovirus-related Pol polyprotein from transposon RE2 [Vitis vinifera]